MITLLARIEYEERESAILYDLRRVQVWTRRDGTPYGKRAPGLWVRVLAWFGL